MRRAFKATADFFYPSIAGKVICADGKERELGEDRYLNRLQEFLARRLPGSTSKHLLQAELDYLGKFLSRLNEMASKGVHASVTLAEAKQGLVGLYFFLSTYVSIFRRSREQRRPIHCRPTQTSEGKIADDS